MRSDYAGALMLTAFVRGEDSDDAMAGAFITARFMRAVTSFLTKR